MRGAYRQMEKPEYILVTFRRTNEAIHTQGMHGYSMDGMRRTGGHRKEILTAHAVSWRGF